MNEKSSSNEKPNAGQFPKGRSGNPSGRPKTTRAPQTSTFDIVLERTLMVPLPSGGTREITSEEALQQQTFQKALKGDRKAQREVLKWVRKREDWLAKNAPAHWPKIIRGSERLWKGTETTLIRHPRRCTLRGIGGLSGGRL